MSKMTTEDNSVKMLTATQVRGILGISETSMKRMLSKGQFPEPTLLGRIRRWRQAEILEIAARQEDIERMRSDSRFSALPKNRVDRLKTLIRQFLKWADATWSPDDLDNLGITKLIRNMRDEVRRGK